jgi:hypothetical protein
MKTNAPKLKPAKPANPARVKLKIRTGVFSASAIPLVGTRS